MYATNNSAWATKKIQNLSELVNRLSPHWVVKMSPEKSLQPISLGITQKDFRLERFVWVTTANDIKPDPMNFRMWESANKVNPFSIVTDPLGYEAWLRTEEGAEVQAKDKEEELGAYVLMLLFVYHIMIKKLQSIGKYTALGMFIALLMFYTKDLVKLYAVANLTYWMFTGTSSQAISSLVPKDPYWIPKRAAHVITSFIPTLPFLKYVWLIGNLVVPRTILTLVRFASVSSTRKAILSQAKRPIRPVWKDAAKEICSKAGQKKCILVH